MSDRLGKGTNLLGKKNLVFGHLYAFGDWRTAVAYNDNGNGDEVAQIATRANIDVDLGLTATERLHACSSRSRTTTAMVTSSPAASSGAMPAMMNASWNMTSSRKPRSSKAISAPSPQA